MAWLRGRFLARGSLSLAGGHAHLEFVVPVDEAARARAAAWTRVGLPAAWRVRRGHGVVTWKSAESITTFLGRIGASASLLELEARQVARSLRGELNRVLNAESANLQRSVAASGRQLAAIDALEADGRLGEQPRTVRAVAAARRETPEASLSRDRRAPRPPPVSGPARAGPAGTARPPRRRGRRATRPGTGGGR